MAGWIIAAVMRLWGAIAPVEAVNAVVAAARGSCEDAATFVAVCGAESNLGGARGHALLCGAYVRATEQLEAQQLEALLDAGVAPPLARRMARWDRTVEGQVAAVERVFLGIRSPLVLRGTLAGWRCGGNSPACRVGPGASYAERVFAWRQEILRGCRAAMQER